MTRLEAFLKANGIKPLALATEAGISRTHLYRLRMGKMDVRIMTALRIRDACGRLISRQLSVSDVFEV
ncbi:MAG TPA: helix-turn-helix transcriptional regulator [Thermoanaerobaculia bacterium]